MYSEEVIFMDVKELQELIEKDDKEGAISEKLYWQELWEHYIEEKSGDYLFLEVRDALPRFISEHNLRQRRNANNCAELGVDIRIGDICYIDFGEAYINEYG